jgi:uncharacterized membrane protein
MKMAGKTSPSKGKTSSKNEKQAQPSRQISWTRIAFGFFAIILILSMVLSAVASY